MSPGRTLVRRRGSILLLLVPATFLLVIAALGLKFDFHPRALYEGDGDLLERVDASGRLFGRDDVVIVVLRETQGEHRALDPGAILWERAFATALKDAPAVQTVRALSTLEIPGGLGTGGPGGLALAPLLPTDLTGPDARAAIETALAPHTRVRDVFISKDERAAVCYVGLDDSVGKLAPLEAAVERVRARIAAFPPPAGHAVSLGGLPAIRVDIVDDLKSEQFTRMPLAGAIFFLVLLVAFRRPSAVAAALLAVLAGLVWTFGTLALLGEELNLVSNILPLILFTIGTANCVHVLNRYAEEHHRRPGRRAAAAARAIRHMGFACLLTYLTTAIGFLSLVGARSHALKAVGLETAVGLLLLYVATILLLGALLPFVNPPRHAAAHDAPGHSVTRMLGGIGLTVARHPWPIFLISLVLIAGSLLTAQDIPVDCRALSTYGPDHPASKTMGRIEQDFGGVLDIDVVFESDTKDAFLDPEVQQHVADLAAFAAEQPEVVGTRSWVELQRAVAGPNAGPEAIPFAHLVCTQLADLLGYRRYMTEDGQHARLELGVADVGSGRLLTLSEKLQSRLDAAFPAGGTVRGHLTGQGYVYALAMDHFIRDMLISLLAAAGIIFGVIAVLFRSARLGMISMIPNLTPLILTLGYMAVRGLPMSAQSVIVFAISLGVAVDNTIHFLARFREEIVRDGDVAHAIQRTLYGAGRAMVLTTVLIVLGLAVLHGSEFLPTQRFAELTSVTMVAALLGDLLLLPACLVLFCRPRRQPA